LVAAVVAVGQETGAADAPASETAPEAAEATGDVPPAESAVEPAEEPLPEKGDVVFLKSGGRIIGQVIRRTPREIEVELVPGVTLKIPRKQVKNVRYDNLSLMSQIHASQGEGEGAKEDLIVGRKVSAALHQKLNQDISEPPSKYENADFVEVITGFAGRLGIAITVDESLQQLPAEQRLWTFEMAPGTTLLQLLEDTFQKTFTGIEVVYKYDEVVLATKEAAQALAPEQVPAGPAPAPPAEIAPADQAPPAEATPPDQAPPAEATPPDQAPPAETTPPDQAPPAETTPPDQAPPAAEAPPDQNAA